MAPQPLHPDDVADLLDWKRHVFQIYWHARRTADPEEAWQFWKVARDALFHGHAQSPLGNAARKRFEGNVGLSYFDYDPAARVEAMVEATDPDHYDIATSGDESYGFTRFATARFGLYGKETSLELYWLDGYGGGLFLPFRDETSGKETYGAGRYLLDTVKGADLGSTAGGKLILDFNFAYNPSCAYDPKWVCPLAPPPNRLKTRIEAGERYENG